MMRSKNEIHAGNESTNIQNSKNVTVNNSQNYGMSYSDVKEIALDIFKNNFYQLSEEAAKVAKMRAEELTDEFLKRIEKNIPDSIQQMKDPGMQYSLLTAQIEYAKTGDRDLAEILLDILLKRIGEQKRNMKQIILNEALSIVPKLTIKQMDILCLIIFIREMLVTDIDDINVLRNTIKEYLVPIIPDLDKEPLFANMRHLEFSGCVSITYISTEGSRLLDFFRKIPNFFVREKFLNFGDYAFVDEETESILLKTAEGEILSDDLLKKYLVYLIPELEKLFDLWDNSLLNNIRLTSVGLFLGNIRLSSKTGLNIDISTLIE